MKFDPEKIKTILDEDVVKHRDQDGKYIGQSRDREDLLGQPYTEHRDSDGKVVGTDTSVTDIFGDARTDHRDATGQHTGSTQHKKDWLGRPVDVYLDRSGNEIGRAEYEKSLLGQDRVNTTGGTTSQVMGSSVRAVTGAATGAASGIGAGVGSVIGGIAGAGPVGLVIAIILGLVAFLWVAGLAIALAIPALISWKTRLTSVVVLVPLLLTILIPLAQYLDPQASGELWEIALAAVLWPVAFFHLVTGAFSDGSAPTMVMLYLGVIAFACLLAYFSDEPE